jgi:hypothetical protein
VDAVPVGQTSYLLRLSITARLSAEQVGARLTGMCLPVLATVTADGRPQVSATQPSGCSPSTWPRDRREPESISVAICQVRSTP